jgi:ribosomal-protein-alanine N-acetyltransferase
MPRSTDTMAAGGSVEDNLGMGDLEIEPLSPGQASDIRSWRYPGRYATYDVNEEIGADQGLFAVVDDGELVGYCCFGQEARVPGVEAIDRVLDIGYGMRPDLMGQERGSAFVSAIIDFGRAHFRPERLRLCIYRWNDRSRNAAQRQGFAVTGRAGEFDVLERAAEPV